MQGGRPSRGGAGRAEIPLRPVARIPTFPSPSLGAPCVPPHPFKVDEIKPTLGVAASSLCTATAPTWSHLTGHSARHAGLPLIV